MPDPAAPPTADHTLAVPAPPRPVGRRFRAWLAALGLVALLLRLALLDEFLRENVISEWPPSDGEVYWNAAGRMAAGQWADKTPFLSAPLYPYLLGVIRALGGGLRSVYVVQILLHIITGLLLGVTTRLRFGSAAGVLAAALFFLLTEPAVSSTRIMPNTLQLLLVVVLWWRWALLAERTWRPGAGPRIGNPQSPLAARLDQVFLVGALVGLLALAYPPALLLVPAYGLWVWRDSGRLRRAGLGMLAACLLIAPATLHNLLLHREFILISAHGGITLRQGNGPTAVGIGDVIPGVSLRRDRMHQDAARVFQQAHGRPGSWREIDRYFRNQAIRWWLENPGAALRLFGRKLYLYLTARHYDMLMPTVIERELHINDRAVLAPLATPWLMGAALAGLLAVLRRPARFAPEWLLCLLPLLVVLLFFYAPRYRLPAVPLLCGLAAQAVVSCRGLRWGTLGRVLLILLPLPLWLMNLRLGFDAPDFNRTFFVRALSEATVESGNRRAQAGNWAGAEQRYREALELWPGNAAAHQQLGLLYARQGRFAEAEGELRTAIARRPDYLPARLHLYNVYCRQKRYADAAETLRAALERWPGHVRAHVALAWLLATCPDDSVRDGDEALRHAKSAQRLADGPRSDVLDALAAAYAELGWFDQAARTGRLAAEQAWREGRTTVAEQIERRVRNYRRQIPCRAPPLVVRPTPRR